MKNEFLEQIKNSRKASNLEDWKQQVIKLGLMTIEPKNAISADFEKEIA
jgi:hypothetical protein